MKKTKRLVALIICIVAVIAIVGGGAASYALNIAEKNSIGEEKAIEIALADAGFTKEEVFGTKAGLSLQDGMLIYDVEFSINLAEFDYDIKASDGTIIKKDVDGEYNASVTTTQASTQSTTQPDNAISLEEAKAIALKHANVSANDATFTKEEFDEEDDRWIYDLKFATSTAKYEYEINAQNGNILRNSSEMIFD